MIVGMYAFLTIRTFWLKVSQRYKFATTELPLLTIDHCFSNDIIKHETNTRKPNVTQCADLGMRNNTTFRLLKAVFLY